MGTRRFDILLAAVWLAIESSPLPAGESMRGLWVYETASLMRSEEETKALFDFCRKRAITDLFWQVHFYKDRNSPCTLLDAEITRLFLTDARRFGLRIHALTGDPAHTRTAKHDRVFALTDALIQFNSEGKEAERFDGLHLDIEPHGLSIWKDSETTEKCDLLTQFVEVHAGVAERIVASGSGLLLGSDIVFWLDKVDADGTPIYPVTFRGVHGNAASHLLKIVDLVAIMSYRNTTEGRNGIISLVSNTISCADKSNAKVFVGVKMADIGLELETFFGHTEAGMMAALEPVETTFRSHPSFAGLAFFHYEAFKAMP